MSIAGHKPFSHTGYGSFESAKIAVNLGAFAYVEKLGNPDELLRHVHRACREEIHSYADKLEAAVAQRTKEFEDANDKLRSEIIECKRTEEKLEQSTSDLKKALAELKTMQQKIV